MHAGIQGRLWATSNMKAVKIQSQFRRHAASHYHATKILEECDRIESRYVAKICSNGPPLCLQYNNNHFGTPTVAWKGHPFLLTAILNLGHSNFQLGSFPALTRPRYVQWNLYKGGNGILERVALSWVLFTKIVYYGSVPTRGDVLTLRVAFMRSCTSNLGGLF